MQALSRTAIIALVISFNCYLSFADFFCSKDKKSSVVLKADYFDFQPHQSIHPKNVSASKCIPVVWHLYLVLWLPPCMFIAFRTPLILVIYLLLYLFSHVDFQGSHSCLERQNSGARWPDKSLGQSYKIVQSEPHLWDQSRLGKEIHWRSGVHKRNGFGDGFDLSWSLSVSFDKILQWQRVPDCVQNLLVIISLLV